MIRWPTGPSEHRIVGIAAMQAPESESVTELLGRPARTLFQIGTRRHCVMSEEDKEATLEQLWKLPALAEIDDVQ